MIKIAFVTGNKEKFEVAKNYFKHISASKLDLFQQQLDVPEIQDESVENIARESALWASKKLNTSVIVSDVGLYIESLKGFPGPFIKYANKWLSSEDFINLMKDHKDRSAYFTDAIAYASPEGETAVFTSITSGSIATTLHGTRSDWTIDNLFVPDGYAEPLALIPDVERSEVWNTDRWGKMASYLEDQTK